MSQNEASNRKRGLESPAFRRGERHNREATMTVRNSTLVGNTANTSGGAIDVLNGTATIINNTFLNNSAPNAGTIRMQVTGTITNNIISGGVGQCSGGVIDATNLSNVVCGSATVFLNLGLGVFDGRVVPLLATSPALNRLPAPCADMTDQLGNRRPFGFGCDVGAVEFANPTFTEQQFLIAMQTQATIQNSVVYPLVLDIVPNGMEIALSDNAWQIGTASLIFTHQSGVLQISIIQTTGIFGDVIIAQLPQLVMLTLNDLLDEAGIADIRIRTMTINPASITFEMGAS